MTLLTLSHQHSKMSFPLQDELLLVTDSFKVHNDSRGSKSLSSSTTDPTKNGQKKVNTKVAKRRRNKSIRFNRKVQLRTMLHINDYTAEEVDACWYTPEEVQSIHDDIDMVLLDCSEQAKHLPQQQRQQQQEEEEEKCEGKTYDDSSTTCDMIDMIDLPYHRGLERKLYKNRQVVRSRISNGCIAVLEEQELQWEEGVTDEEYISRVYKVASRSSVALREAQMRALQDQLEASR